MKQAYLRGVKECEVMYQEGCSFDELEKYIEVEASIGGIWWETWVDGFVGAIEHFKRLEEIGNENT